MGTGGHVRVGGEVTISRIAVIVVVIFDVVVNLGTVDAMSVFRIRAC